VSVTSRLWLRLLREIRYKLKKVIIDTGVFEYAFVKPKEPEFSELHQKANSWLIAILKRADIEILMKTYQIAEVLEVFRKVGSSKEARESFVDIAQVINPLVNWITIEGKKPQKVGR